MAQETFEYSESAQDKELIFVGYTDDKIKIISIDDTGKETENYSTFNSFLELRKFIKGSLKVRVTDNAGKETTHVLTLNDFNLFLKHHCINRKKLRDAA